MPGWRGVGKRVIGCLGWKFQDCSNSFLYDPPKRPFFEKLADRWNLSSKYDAMLVFGGLIWIVFSFTILCIGLVWHNSP